MNAQPTRLSPLHGTHVSAGATMMALEAWQVARAIRSATDEVAAASSGVGLADLSDRAKIMVEGNSSAALLKNALGGSDLAVNQAARGNDDGLYIASLRRERFYVSAPTGREGKLIDTLNAAIAKLGEHITVTDETDARSELLLVGPNAATCLSRTCALDFRESEFPNLTAKQSSVAKIRQLVLRCDGAKMPAYIVSGGRSNAIYLWQTLIDAGHDLSMQTIGRQAVEAIWS